jgi:hypothetical protein
LVTDSALLQGAQVFIDGIEVLAEDYSSAAALKLVRALLAAIKESKGMQSVSPS